MSMNWPGGTNPWTTFANFGRRNTGPAYPPQEGDPRLMFGDGRSPNLADINSWLDRLNGPSASEPAVDPGSTGAGGGGGKRFIIDSIDLGTQVLVQYSDGTQGFIPKGRFGSEGSPYEGQRVDLERQRVGLEREGLAQNWQKFVEQMGLDKSMFDQRQGLDNKRFGLEEAIQNWRMATDARDFEAAEKWRTEAARLARQQFAQSQYTDEAAITQSQNAQTQNYLNMLLQLRGPQDWARYWHTSRGETTPRGAEAVPFEQAVPAWAQPRMLADRASFANAPAWGGGTVGGQAGGLPGGQTQTGGGNNGVPPPPPPAAPAPTEPVFTSNGVTPGATVQLKTTNGVTTVGEPTLAMTGPNNRYMTMPLTQFGGKEPAWLRAAMAGQSVYR